VQALLSLSKHVSYTWGPHLLFDGPNKVSQKHGSVERPRFLPALGLIRHMVVERVHGRGASFHPLNGHGEDPDVSISYHEPCFFRQDLTTSAPSPRSKAPCSAPKAPPWAAPGAGEQEAPLMSGMWVRAFPIACKTLSAAPACPSLM